MNLLAFFLPMFDPIYLLFLAPGLLLALWAEAKVKSAYAMASKRLAGSGLTGAEAAQRILDMSRIDDVRIEPIKTMLGDHYDPRGKVLRLSPDVYAGRSLASLGIAAHEAGHAIQHATNYGPLALRSGLLPVAAFGTQFSFILILAGMLLAPFYWLAWAGLAFFAAAVLFQLITLPVEFDASRRARAILLNNGLVSSAEDPVVGKVLNAAALTYVAAAVTALLQLLYFALLVAGRRH